MSNNVLSIRKKVIRILNCSHTDCICIRSSIVNNLLRLCSSLCYNLVCLCICLLHNLMFTYKFCCLYLCFFDHSISFRLCICQNRISISDNLLITFDLVWRFHTKLS